ncbi:MAG: glutaminase, partial [Oscillospiraceae bacterium]|nr:glutaminase [Oscillospiraceae bacterium]
MRLLLLAHHHLKRGGSLIINEEKLSRALEHARPHIAEGRVASYIPELSKADANDLGICVHTIDGQRFRFGDWDRRFTIQSISKVINLAVALEHSGADAVFKRIRMEPSGAAFNSMQRISDNEDIPFNPMV